MIIIIIIFKLNNIINIYINYIVMNKYKVNLWKLILLFLSAVFNLILIMKKP